METFLDCPSHSECLENAKNGDGCNAHFQEFETPTTDAVFRKLFKTMSDFFFCRVQPYYVLYYEAKKSRKKSKTKI